jgi:Tfp pilus assembly protein PilN
VLAFALVAVVALVLTSNTINDSKSDLASLQAREAAAQQAAASLAPYNDFATLSSNRNQTVSDLARSRFDWERVLQELALVIPSDVTLETLNATAAGDAASTGGTSTAISGPSLQIGGCADGQEGVAQMLAALRDIDGVTRVGMQSSELADAAAGPSSGPADSATACTAKGVASFQVTVAFDAVPVAASATTDPGAVAATDTTTTPTDSTSTEGADAQTQNEQAAATNSAETQSRKAKNAANAVGAGG